MKITKPVLKEALIISIILLIYTWGAGMVLEPFLLEKLEVISVGGEMGIGDILLAIVGLFVVSYLGVFLMGLIVNWTTSISISTLVVGLWIHTCLYYMISIVVLYFSTEEEWFNGSELSSAFITGIISGTLAGSLGYYIGHKTGKRKELNKKNAL
ncbi:MAG: Unknown protein [uncultured Aureispira sp.]|uniref:Uncharacterized protein n=1 Tax=uncultured Aureispira sp. TaxID=1331704 RepID=A0A6S6S6V5_9BACT|nr:MAG: Unknown protein [uncultured Aureispira sp.]